MNFKCIVVLYNVNYKESVSYMDLIQTDYYKQGKMEIICVDNSVKDFGNGELMAFPNHAYIDMQGNKGLPKAYNAAIKHLFGQKGGKNNLFILLDDDTHIGNEYFEKMEQASQSEGDIYLPIVLDQVGILSPSIMKKYRCRRCSSLEQIHEKNICGINSGMAIKKQVFENYRYNEDMFLDYVDHYFIRDMKQQGKKIEVVDTTLQQNFSSITDSYEQTLKRFHIFQKDIRVFYSRGTCDRLIYFYIILRRKFGIFLKFRNPSVFWKC